MITDISALVSDVKSFSIVLRSSKFNIIYVIFFKINCRRCNRHKCQGCRHTLHVHMTNLITAREIGERRDDDADHVTFPWCFLRHRPCDDYHCRWSRHSKAKWSLRLFTRRTAVSLRRQVQVTDDDDQGTRKAAAAAASAAAANLGAMAAMPPEACNGFSFRDVQSAKRRRRGRFVNATVAVKLISPAGLKYSPSFL